LGILQLRQQFPVLQILRIEYPGEPAKKKEDPEVT
jgi:hypothetical protein